MALILDGKQAALQIKSELKEKFSQLERKACLAIIHYDDFASASYLKGRLKIADELGVEIKVYDLNDTHDDAYLLSLIEKLNNDKSIDGIMIDRPLPKQFNEFKALSFISSDKDVDGYTINNLGKLISNKDCYMSCTPLAAIRLAKFYGIDFTSKDVVVIGRSINVGKPLALMLLNENATVTVCHSKTKNIKEKCKQADIIFLALGKKGFLDKQDITKNATIIDIGINYDEFGKICGDANRNCYEVAACYSPVPGGVGVMTNVVLMENLLQAYYKNK